MSEYHCDSSGYPYTPPGRAAHLLLVSGGLVKNFEGVILEGPPVL